MLDIGKILGILGLMILMMACGSKSDKYLDRMAKEHADDKPVQNAAADIAQSGETDGEVVTYADVQGTEVTGYLAKPDNATGDEPGVIVIHEWWGLNDNIRMMTEKLAGEGYTALAVDLYYGKVAESPDSAGTYARNVETNQALSNLTQAYNYLMNEHSANKIGVIGWCFGGAWSLQTALAHPKDIDATVIYYGRLQTEREKLAKLEMPILGIFGAEDDGIPVETVREFERTLEELDKNASIHIYEGADHAFANPSGNRYKKDAAEDAWQKTIAFFDQYLK